MIATGNVTDSDLQMLFITFLALSGVSAFSVRQLSLLSADITKNVDSSDKINQSMLTINAADLKQIQKGLTDEVTTFAEVIDSDDEEIDAELLLIDIEVAKSNVASVNKTITFVSIAAVSSIVALLLFIIGMSSAIYDPIEQLKEMLTDIANGNGDLTKRLRYKANNEFGDISTLFNQFASKLQRTVADEKTNVADMDKQIVAMTEEANRATNDISTQKEATTMIATSMNEMEMSVQEVASNSKEAASAANATSQTANDGQGIVLGTIKSIETLAGNVENASGVITQLEEDSTAMRKVNNIQELLLKTAQSSHEILGS